MNKKLFKKVKFSTIGKNEHFFDYNGNEYIRIRQIKLDPSELVKGEDPLVNCLFYKSYNGLDTLSHGAYLGTLHFVPSGEEMVYIKK